MQARNREQGSTSMLVLGVLVVTAFLMVILGAVGGAYVAHAELQQAADVAASSIERGGDDPIEHARAMARANGARTVSVDASGAGSRLRVQVTAPAPRLLGIAAGTELHAEAWADIPDVGDGGPNPAGEYHGPLQLAGGVPVCPVVAAAFDRMAASARAAGIGLTPTSGFRTYAEQAVLYARLGPAIAAPPGSSRHHDATELDIAVGPSGSAVHRWLVAHGAAFGFIQRYSWEPWHWGYVRGC